MINFFCTENKWNENKWQILLFPMCNILLKKWENKEKEEKKVCNLTKCLDL